jgi:hypothetical protein
MCRELCRRYNIKETVFVGVIPRGHPLDFTDWLNKPPAQRGLLHAVAIVDIVEQLPQGRSHSIHLPFSLFSAAIIYALHAVNASATVHLPQNPNWTDVVMSVEEVEPSIWSSHESDTLRFICGTPAPNPGPWNSRNLFYELNSVRKLLQFISSQWGVASDMGSIVEQWIELCH